MWGDEGCGAGVGRGECERGKNVSEVISRREWMTSMDLCTGGINNNLRGGWMDEAVDEDIAECGRKGG